MTKFCEFLREHAMKIINLEKNEVIDSSRNHMKVQKSVLFVKKNLKIDIWKMKNILKLEIIVIKQENIKVLHITYAI